MLATAILLFFFVYCVYRATARPSNFPPGSLLWCNIWVSWRYELVDLGPLSGLYIIDCCFNRTSEFATGRPLTVFESTNFQAIYELVREVWRYFQLAYGKLQVRQASVWLRDSHSDWFVCCSVVVLNSLSAVRDAFKEENLAGRPDFPFLLLRSENKKGSVWLYDFYMMMRNFSIESVGH